jgi:Fe-S-cluster-containing dehydrogenase component
MNRRNFVKTLSAMGISTIPLSAKDKIENSNPEFYSVLIDTTYCAGCRSCEEACAEVNGLPEIDPDDSVFDVKRNTSTRQLSLVNRYETDNGEIYSKKQCMHCAQPACVSACLTKAMYKTKEGPVIWREDKCMGCRFCMLSCPFDIPKFEYDSNNPSIKKCTMCFSRLTGGEIPACAEVCPSEAIIFGRRSELMRIARERIVNNPDEYYDHIYGEHEAGGTGVLYLSSVPFEQLGFRNDIGNESYPELTTGFLYSVPIILTLWPPFLLALSNSTKKDNTETGLENNDDEE